MAIHAIHIVPNLIKTRARIDGTCQVRFAVNYRSRTAYIPANVWVLPEHWHNRKVIKHPQAAKYNAFLRALQVQYEDAVFEIIRNGEQHALDAKGVRDLILAKVSPTENAEATINEVLKELEQASDKPGTAYQYTAVLRALEDYARGPLSFYDITADWCKKFNKYLEKKNQKQNTRVIYFSKLRRAFNVAIDSNRTRAKYPFKEFSLSREPVEPRNYTVNELKKFFATAGESASECYWLDMFKLSFLLIGINLADLYNVDSLERGRLVFHRKKTGRRYSVAVLPEAAEIIERHKGKNRLLDISDVYTSIAAAKLRANAIIHAVAKRAGLPDATWYTARYSWASIAANELEVSVETISLALGHTYGRAVTLGYISNDFKKVDKANEEICALVFGEKTASSRDAAVKQ